MRRKILILNTNYRSENKIVIAANNLAKRFVERHPKNIISFGNDEINLYVIFENAYSGRFTIPKQTLNLPILHPLSNTNTLVNTNIIFDGFGKIVCDNGYKLSLTYRYEYLTEFWYGKLIECSFN